MRLIVIIRNVWNDNDLNTTEADEFKKKSIGFLRSSEGHENIARVARRRLEFRPEDQVIIEDVEE